VSDLDASTTQIIVKCPRCKRNVELRMEDRYLTLEIPPELVADFRGPHDCEDE
jgi:hypothetical protein